MSIVSDRDSRFMSHFWRSLQSALGTQLSFQYGLPSSNKWSVRVHYQDPGGYITRLHDGFHRVPGRIILPLVEFAYNNNFQANIDMAPFIALYGRRCRTPLSWDDVGDNELSGPDLIVEDCGGGQGQFATVFAIAQDHYKHWVVAKRRHLEFDKGDPVFLKILPNQGVILFDRRGMLSPRFICPFPIDELVGEVAYRLVFACFFGWCSSSLPYVAATEVHQKSDPLHGLFQDRDSSGS